MISTRKISIPYLGTESVSVPFLDGDVLQPFCADNGRVIPASIAIVEEEGCMSELSCDSSPAKLYLPGRLRHCAILQIRCSAYELQIAEAVFPEDRFVKWEEKDLQWALPLGFAKVRYRSVEPGDRVVIAFTSRNGKAKYRGIVERIVESCDWSSYGKAVALCAVIVKLEHVIMEPRHETEI